MSAAADWRLISFLALRSADEAGLSGHSSPPSVASGRPVLLGGNEKGWSDSGLCGSERSPPLGPGGAVAGEAVGDVERNGGDVVPAVGTSMPNDTLPTVGVRASAPPGAAVAFAILLTNRTARATLAMDMPRAMRRASATTPGAGASTVGVNMESKSTSGGADIAATLNGLTPGAIELRRGGGKPAGSEDPGADVPRGQITVGERITSPCRCGALSTLLTLGAPAPGGGDARTTVDSGASLAAHKAASNCASRCRSCSSRSRMRLAASRSSGDPSNSDADSARI